MLAVGLVGASIVAGCSSAATAPALPDITAAPTQIARTALGTVGYREVGMARPCS
jgi:hypothetical protein